MNEVNVAALKALLVELLEPGNLSADEIGDLAEDLAASGVLVPVQAGWLISSFAPAISTPVSGSRVIDGSFCLFCGNASPWSKSTSWLDEADGPAAPAAGAAVSGTAARLSIAATAATGMKRRIWHPFRHPPQGGSNHAGLSAAIQDPVLSLDPPIN